MMQKPFEWVGLTLGVIAMDVYYYKSKKRPTLSATVKKLNKDPVTRSLAWALWGWLTWHFFVEKD